MTELQANSEITTFIRTFDVCRTLKKSTMCTLLIKFNCSLKRKKCIFFCQHLNMNMTKNDRRTLLTNLDNSGKNFASITFNLKVLIFFFACLIKGNCFQCTIIDNLVCYSFFSWLCFVWKKNVRMIIQRESSLNISIESQCIVLHCIELHWESERITSTKNEHGKNWVSMYRKRIIYFAVHFLSIGHFGNQYKCALTQNSYMAKMRTQCSAVHGSATQRAVEEFKEKKHSKLKVLFWLTFNLIRTQDCARWLNQQYIHTKTNGQA